MKIRAGATWKRDTLDMLRRSNISLVQISDETQLLYSWIQKFGDEKHRDVSFGIDNVQILYNYLVRKEEEQQKFRAVYSKKRDRAKSSKACEDTSNANS